MKPYFDRDGITLFCGDCREVLPQLAPATFSLVLTDPQYGISLPGGDFERASGDGKRRFDFFPVDDNAGVMATVEQAIRLAHRVTTKRASWYAKGRTWTPRPGDPPFSNVLRYDAYRNGQPGKVDHPTQKPLGLFTELIRYSAKEGQCVLDPFAGSGTALVAARDCGCRAVGIEREERYCEIIADRLSQGVLFGATS